MIRAVASTLVFAALFCGSALSAPPRVYQAFATWNAHLCRPLTRIKELSVTFELTAPAHVFTWGYVNCKLRPWQPDVQAQGGLVMRYRYSPTLAGLDSAPVIEIRGAKSTGNIISLHQHYIELDLHSYGYRSQPGWYRYEVWGAFDGIPSVDGLVEVNGDGGSVGPYNQMTLMVLDAQ